MFTNVRLNNITLSFRSSSVLYSGFTVVILASVNITESISHLCVYLRKLQKQCHGVFFFFFIWNTLFHPGVCFFLLKGEEHVFDSISHLAQCWNPDCAGALSICLLLLFPWKVTCCACEWEHAVTVIMDLCSEANEEHDEERVFPISCQIRRVRSERQIHFLTARAPYVTLQTLGSSRL